MYFHGSGEKIVIKNGEIAASSQKLQSKIGNFTSTFDGAYYKQKIYNNQTEDGKTDTSINYEIKTESEINNLESIVDAEKSTEYVKYTIKDFDIYITYDKKFVQNDYDKVAVILVKALENYEDIMYISVPICGILTVVMIVYLIMSIGYKKGKKGIELNDIDKIPLEIIIFLVLAVLFLVCMFLDFFIDANMFYQYKLVISGAVTIYLIAYAFSAIVITTIIKRIKTKTFIKTTLTWKVLLILQKWINSLKNIFGVFTERINLTWKILGILIGYFAVMGIILILYADVSNIEIGILIDIAITAFLFYKIIKRVNSFKKIEDKLKDIYEGNNKEKLDEESFEKEFKQMVRIYK